ncbi:mechanosensitive ion channel family protein [Ferruginivarius sediminum]|uniref:Small-conductance mechanosensitive channel n=1 Tax=Ferruginivarius sediminum TaxID=2661937 RepID=A0A369T8P8_9PROT|nr:mechanosensitive ion channel domain-containing protein [Ferruginivarius sediminum]RDD60547.1 mechanosensitive ion channel family protein [Ferruginivarius sediminum]
MDQASNLEGGETLQRAMELVTSYGMSVLGGIAILIVGWIAANWISGGVRRSLTRAKRVDDTLRGFLVSLVKYVILAFVVIAVLSQFGVQTASLIAIFGAAGLAVGLALQGTLSNVSAGVMLLLFRPIRVGQYVEVAGQAGTVREINLFVTELATPDNVQIIIPNSQVWGTSVVNYSHHTTRRVDFTLGIAYADSIERAMSAIHEVLKAESRILGEPEPQVVVGALSDSSVDIIVRVWAKAEDYWPVRFDLTRKFKETFDAKGISIPFPQREVHVFEHKSETTERKSA